ncbi:MAG: AMP-dependent synthetase and ligase [Actinomycetia bacterium]|nr:AMP-dependent synthetase and ligase [Actinomycetes bacterium]
MAAHPTALAANERTTVAAGTPLEASTVLDYLDHWADTTPEAEAFREAGGPALTYAELDRASRALASRLTEQAPGAQRGVLLSANGLVFTVALFGAMRAGIQLGLLNPAYARPEIDALLDVVDPDVVLIGPGHPEVGAIAAPLIRLDGPGTVEELVRPGAAFTTPPRPAADDGAVLLFTGGTTGRSKAADHTHRNLVRTAEAMASCWPTGDAGDTWLTLAPMFHVWGLLMGCVNPLRNGARVIIEGTFDPAGVCRDLATHRVAVFGGGPPAIYAALLGSGALASEDLGALRLCPSGGAPMPAALARSWEEATGLPIIEGYGMSEAAPLTANPSPPRFGSAGRPAPGVEIEIRDLASDEPVAAGASGEVVVRTDRTMRGYLGLAAEGAAVDAAGWFRTGDIGFLDADGFLFLQGRSKELLIVNGFNVYPREVEEVLVAHPAVREAAVIGVADDALGERPFAFVVLAEDRPGILDEVAGHCRDRLVRHKRPDSLVPLDALPRTGANKTDKQALRRLAEERIERGPVP